MFTRVHINDINLSYTIIRIVMSQQSKQVYT